MLAGRAMVVSRMLSSTLILPLRYLYYLLARGFPSSRTAWDSLKITTGSTSVLETLNVVQAQGLLCKLTG